MAINPSIPALAYSGSGQRGGMSTMGDLMEVAKTFREARQIDKHDAAEREVREALKTNGGDWDDAITTLKQRGYGAEALAIQERVTKERSMVQQNLASQLKNEQAKVDLVLPMLNAAKDQSSYDRVRQTIAKWSPEISNMLDPVFDPDRVQQYAHMGLTVKESIAERREALEDLASGKLDLAAARWASTVKSPEEYQYFLQGAAAMGIPRSMREQFGAQFSPELPVAAAKKVQELTAAGVTATGASSTRSLTQPEIFERDYIAAEAEKLGVPVATLSPQQLTTLRTAARAEWAKAGSTRASTGGAGQPASYESDFIAMRAAELGKTVEELTPKERVTLKEEARQRWMSSGRSGARSTATNDNAQLPNGVRNYLQDLTAKYGTVKEALDELTRAENSLYADHPKLDIEQAKKVLRGLFDKKPKTSARTPSGTSATPAPTPVEQRTTTGDVNLGREVQTRAGRVAVGSIVTMRDGSRVQITAIHPDGTFDSKPAPAGR